MKNDCIKLVEQTIGRALGRGEAERIEQRLAANFRELARTDPGFQGMSHNDRLIAAAKKSMEQDQGEAARAAQRKALNLTAQIREVQAQAVRASEFSGKNRFHQALFERLVQLDNYVTGVRNELFGNLVDTIRASSPKFLGLIENREAATRFVREVYGEKTGDAEAAKAAKSYLDVMEKIRLRENASGADIAKLDYGYLPQPHDTGAVARAGKEQWVAKVAPLMKRDRFVNADGTQMNDAELNDLLSYAYDTIATNGQVRREAGQGGQGSRASRFDDKHRVLHFKDADSYLKYLDEFGEGSTFEAIHNHVGAHAKNIGLMESFGSNPNSTYRLLKDTAEIEDSRAAGKEVTGVTKFMATPDMIYDTISGATAAPVNARGAAVGQAVRNYTGATKLGGVMLSSINDVPTWLATAKYNGIPLGEALPEAMKAIGSSNIAEDAARLGLAVESMSGEMQTWHAGNMRNSWSGKLANATMRLQFVESWTQRLRAGMGIMLSDHLASLTREKSWGDLSTFDRERMTKAGVTERDWQVWQAATPENIRDRDLLTVNAIRETPDVSARDANHAAAALLGFIDNEAKTAVIAPDVVTRAAMTQGARAGTLGGELGRSVMLFKSFPLAMLLRNLDRIRDLGKDGAPVSRAAYSAALMVGLTLFGALSVELKDLASGKNPRDATTGKFWGAAFAQGGGLGIFGDMLYTGMGGNSRGGQPNWSSLAGPVLGTGVDALNVTLGNLGQALQGKETHAGAEALRFTRQNLPLLNLWYAKAAIDHMGFQALQESLSPGYLARQRAQAQKDWGQTYWWQPGAGLPDEAPRLAEAVGE